MKNPRARVPVHPADELVLDPVEHTIRVDANTGLTDVADAADDITVDAATCSGELVRAFTSAVVRWHLDPGEADGILAMGEGDAVRMAGAGLRPSTAAAHRLALVAAIDRRLRLISGPGATCREWLRGSCARLDDREPLTLLCDQAGGAARVLALLYSADMKMGCLP